jgi:hypothetical protein
MWSPTYAANSRPQANKETTYSPLCVPFSTTTVVTTLLTRCDGPTGADECTGNRPRSPPVSVTTAPPLAEDRPGGASDDVVAPTAQVRPSSRSRPQPTALTSISGPARPRSTVGQVRPDSPSYGRYAPNRGPNDLDDADVYAVDGPQRVASRTASNSQPSRLRLRPESSKPTRRSASPTEHRPAPAQQQRSAETAQPPLPTSVQASPATQLRESMDVALELAQNYINAFTAGTERGRSAVSFNAAAVAEAAVATAMGAHPSSPSVLQNLKRTSYGGRASSSSTPTKKPRQESGSPKATPTGPKRERPATSRSPTPSGPKRERPATSRSPSSDNRAAVCGYPDCLSQRIHSACRNQRCSTHCRDEQLQAPGHECRVKSHQLKPR